MTTIADVDWTRTAAEYSGEADPEALKKLADGLGISTASLLRLSVGWDGQAWTFPERDGTGLVIGVSRRFPSGEKGFHSGGRRGLAFEASEHGGVDPYTGTVLVVEGATDAAAGMDLGFAAVGRPGAAACVDMVVELLRGRNVVIVGENDDAGRAGAEAVCGGLTGKARTVRVIYPPEPFKDLRAWFQAGLTREGLQAAIDAIPEPEPEPECLDVRQFHVTDAGQAELFAYLNRDGVRFDHRRGRWLTRNDHAWTPDADGEIHRRAIGAARTRYLLAGGIDNLHDREDHAAFAIRAESRQKLDAVLSLAKSVRPLADAGTGWDSDPWLLGVANGVVDLRTGELRPGRPEDRITMQVPFDFDPAARCPRWESFLSEIFEDDDLITFLWRAVGYSLSGAVTEQCLFVLHGPGANGKSVFLGTLRHVLGPYATDTPFTTFDLLNRASIPNDLAALYGKRLVTASESGEGMRLNEARVKALTGGDAITARFLHGEFFTFNPTCKLWLSTNHKPAVHDDSFAFWRRVRLIPFKRQFREGEADPNLTETLKGEASGILTWAVGGGLEWQRRGLTPPAAVRDATAEYERESDPVGHFIEECCIEGPGFKAPAAALYKAYRDWSQGQGYRPGDVLTSTAFGRRIGERYRKDRGVAGIVYAGIGLQAGGSE